MQLSVKTVIRADEEGPTYTNTHTHVCMHMLKENQLEEFIDSYGVSMIDELWMRIYIEDFQRFVLV